MPSIDAGGAGGERRADRLGGAQPAADLHRHVDSRRDPLDVLEVRRRAGARAVEVDDVQRPRAVVDPASWPRRADRRRRRSAGVEVAAREPHRLAVEDVDRRQQDHARAAAGRGAAAPPQPRTGATKFASSASPSPEDFSGWNWTPNTLSARDDRREPLAVLGRRRPRRPGRVGRAASECTW